jgi:hypothetical protein
VQKAIDNDVYDSGIEADEALATRFQANGTPHFSSTAGGSWAHSPGRNSRRSSIKK